MDYLRKITLSNDLSEVSRLAEPVSEVCQAVGFNQTTTCQMNLVVEEAVVNVIDYAFPPDSRNEIEVTMKTEDGFLVFVISDGGKPFDPTTKGNVDTTLSAEDRQVGGLGIFLMREMVDDIIYKYVDGRNVLTLKKKI